MHEFKTDGMTCGKCVSHVTQALKSVDSKAEVTVKLEEQRVSVRSEEAGYPVLESRTLAD